MHHNTHDMRYNDIDTLFVIKLCAIIWYVKKANAISRCLYICIYYK